MDNQVIWKQGILVLPQHFQQQERHNAAELLHNTRQIQPHYWGFSQIQISTSDLAFGSFSLLQCAGSFQDGTSFNAPQNNNLPKSIKLEDGLTNVLIYLVLPQRQINVNDVNFDSSDVNVITRLKPRELNVKDVASSNHTVSTIIVGDIDYRIMISSDKAGIPDGMLKLAIARVKEVSSGRIILCEEFIPNLVNALVSPRLMRFLTELRGMLSARGDALSTQATNSGRTTGVTEYSDFLLLQLINRLEPLVNQYIANPIMHPSDLYFSMLSVAGELSTFMKSNRRPASFPLYNHDNLTSCFEALINDIDSSFNVVLEQIASQIELSKPKNNIRAARLSHKALLENGVLILAVAANIPEETLRTELPAQIKIGPGEKIFTLVQSALPGIPIRLLSHVPSEIPYRSGYCYFELDKMSSLWPELQQSKGLALHVSGNHPGLTMELWAINRK
ncbi:type VI secretion system baseplate subunit TssK [Rheinheimera maricola]|uniref:Type VI secretion system baseplate subunit TssK n=1 Tax=Rheinheimera maricola TaxID=2793282 RepID=A0ABS7XD10_9GAMM|nr:type VI secretion system baseplate subunit TssK [Rheinheimera maricola]MBZ9613435.1 type VI secretion system baseplate subunit TssK [Rheinheimera maricola]